MSARAKARKRALDILYSADVRTESIEITLEAESKRADVDPKRESSWTYAKQIVAGVIEHQTEIDDLIETHLREWTLDRLPAIDRAILRIGVWELVFNDDIPIGVGISQAVDAATVYSTEDSAGFVNGILAAIAASKT